MNPCPHGRISIGTLAIDERGLMARNDLDYRVTAGRIWLFGRMSTPAYAKALTACSAWAWSAKRAIEMSVRSMGDSCGSDG
jgi:hypothetical protein